MSDGDALDPEGHGRAVSAGRKWRLHVPTVPHDGPCDVATVQLLRRAGPNPQKLVDLLSPYLGLCGSPGSPPLTAEQASLKSGVTQQWVHHQLRRVRALAAAIGPPPALLAATQCAGRAGIQRPVIAAWRWRADGHTARVLHPASVIRIAEFWGVPALFTISRDERWLSPLVIADGLDARVRSAAAAIRSTLRSVQMLEPDQIGDLLPDLPAGAVTEALAGFGFLARDGLCAVGRAPAGIDAGLGRIMIAAGGPLRTDPLWTALNRWSTETRSGLELWTAQRMERYLFNSPLYLGSSEQGWQPADGWARSAQTDRDVLEALLKLGGTGQMHQLAAALIAAGRRPRTAERLIITSPVLTRVGHGRYTRVGADL